MTISITEVYNQDLERKFQIVVSWPLLEQKINKRAEKDQENFSMNGFRKGQVPLSIIKEKNADFYLEKELQSILEKTSNKIIDDYKLKPASYPKMYVEKAKQNEDIEAKISFELMPDVGEIDLSQFSLEKYELILNDEVVDSFVKKELKSFLNQQKQQPDYQAKIGDIVVIDYIGTVDGEQFEQGLYANQKIELGSKTLVDTFEDQIVGSKQGDQISVTVHFPADYFRPKYISKTGQFQVSIKEIYCYENQEFSDEFIAKNTTAKNLDDLKSQTRTKMINGYNTTLKNINKKNLFDQIDTMFKIDLPKSLIETQMNVINNQPNLSNLTPDQKDKLAKRMVRSGIVINQISESNKIKIEEKDFREKVMQITAFFSQKEFEGIMEEISKNQDMQNQIVGSIVEDKVIDIVLQSCQITERKIDAKEVDNIWYDINNNLNF